MKRIVLGFLPHILGSGCAVEAAPPKESDKEGMTYFNPTFKYSRPKETWQGQGNRKKPRIK